MCCNNNSVPNVPAECRDIPNRLEKIFVNTITMEAFDENGDFVGMVDNKGGILLISNSGKSKVNTGGK